MHLFSVMTNLAGNEAATETVLYSGLTRSVAAATVRSCWEMADDEDANFYIRRDEEVKTFRVEAPDESIVFHSNDIAEASGYADTKNQELVNVGYEPTFRILTGEGDYTFVLKHQGL